MLQHAETPLRGGAESPHGVIEDLTGAEDPERTLNPAPSPTATPTANPAPNPIPNPAAGARELTRLLFDADGRDRIHTEWRRLVSGEAFAHRPGLSPAERTALSYERLRLVNDTVAGAGAEVLCYDAHRLAALHEWTGFIDGGLCTLASVHYNLFLGSLLDHDGYRRDLTAYTAMERTGTFLCTELAHGNDVAALETVAVLDRETGGFELHTPNAGAQKFMPNTSLTGGPKTALVAARLLVDGEDQGVFLFLTPLSDEHGHLPGIRVHRLPDRTGTPVDHCLTSFDRLRLPREALLEAAHGRLDKDGRFSSSLGNRRKRFLRSVGRVTVGKLCMSAGTLGMARAALAIAARYAQHRQVAAPRAGERLPLTAHRSHQGRLLGAVATAYAMTFLHRAVLDHWAAHDPTDREDREAAERLVAVAKGWITWQARDITIESRERCGAQGLFPENGLSELPLNVEGGITAEGDNLVIWQKAASELVFAHEAGPANAPEGELTDLAFLRDLHACVERIWQTRARTALRDGPSGDPVGRWNETSGAALEMVAAHARLAAADAFLAATTRATTTRPLLEDLARLFLLHELRPHTGDLLAAGHLTPAQVNALHPTTNHTLATLTPHLPTLTTAFDLPHEFLASIPIANPDYQNRFPH
ncbi:acyl-CoA dehydrogenase [Streptomyces sp. NPDC013740]|uniref:acyl-CoA dehydrogenase family protein n=1 Tax=Streptomyces sp. NPDC013740 TaxID=3364867 RepID=UPI0036FD8ED4